MTGTTQLAEKKLKLLVAPEQKERFEIDFYNTYLLQGFDFSNPETKTLYLHDLPRLAERCKKFGVQLIGVETHLESELPFVSKAFEEFVGVTYIDTWIRQCIEILRKQGILKDLEIYINIPENVFVIVQTLCLVN
jgi:hypothetical protein